MAQSALGTIADMINVIISNTVSTLLKITSLFSELLGSLGIVSVYGGATGLLVSIAIISVVAFFLAKFFFSNGKMLFFLIPIAIIVWIFFLSFFT